MHEWEWGVLLAIAVAPWCRREKVLVYQVNSSRESAL